MEMSSEIKVLVFGTYDVFHPGHNFFFEQALENGDLLIVVVALDKTVEQIKGSLPKNSQEKRLKCIQESKLVNKAILGHPGDKYAVIERINPDVICLGYDQNAFTDKLKSELAKRGLHPKIVRIDKSFFPEKYKSSILK
ncbi:MAG: FAD synthetase [Candidatus Woesearchaeota archaeon]|jgi:FAD synthetase